MKDRRRIEREFGVPIAGETLEPDRWTKTGLKRLPAEGRPNWEGLFGRRGVGRLAACPLDRETANMAAPA